MCQDNCNTKEASRKGKHLNYDERKIIEHLYNIQNKSKAEIARELERHRTTISREIKKGKVELRNTDYSIREEYVADKAQRQYDKNATAKGPKIKIAKDHKMADFIEEKIKGKFSPEVIANDMKENDKFETKLHWKTIYNYIDKGILLVERDDLTYGNYKKTKTKRNREKISTSQRKKGRKISDRPEEAEKREKIGHWGWTYWRAKRARESPFCSC